MFFWQSGKLRNWILQPFYLLLNVIIHDTIVDTIASEEFFDLCQLLRWNKNMIWIGPSVPEVQLETKNSC